VIDQKVWLAARATSYTVVCEEWSDQQRQLATQAEGRR
jgi:hypothetical protein